MEAGSLFKFLFGLLIFVYFPGQAFLKLIRLRPNNLESFTIGLGLGMSLSTVLNKFSRLFDVEWLFFILISVSIIYFFFSLVKNPPTKERFRFRMTGVGAGLIVLFFLVFAVLFFDSYRNGLLQPDGSLVIHFHYYDGFLRNAVIRELSHSVPPEMPFASGFSLSYHYGMDLFISLFYRYLGIGVLDLVHRLTITFFFMLLLPASFLFFREVLSSGEKALYGVFLLIFGSGGMSALASLLFGTHIGGNIFYSFYFFDFLSINSFLPALSLLFCGLFSLLRYLSTKLAPWLILSALFFAFVFEFKIFFTGPVSGLLLFVSLVSYIRFRDLAFLKTLLLTLLFSAPLLLVAYFTNRGSIDYSFSLKFVDWVSRSLGELKIAALRNSWENLIHHGQVSPLNILFSLLGLFVFLSGSLGLSLISLPSLLKKFFSFSRENQAKFFLISLCFVSLVYFFVFHLALGRLPRNILNIYVYYFSLILLNLFWVEKLTAFAASKKPLPRFLVLFLVSILSLPNTIFFLRTKIRYPEPRVFSREFLEATQWLSENTSSDSITLHPTSIRYVCYFADRRVVLDNSIHSYLPFHLRAAEIRRRERDSDRFFYEPILSGDVLEKYRITHIWATSAWEILGKEAKNFYSMECYKDLGTQKIRKYEKSHLLEPVFKNSDYILFKVQEIPPERREVYELIKKGDTYFFKKFFASI